MKLDASKYLLAMFIAPLGGGLGYGISDFSRNFDLNAAISWAVFVTPVAYPFALLGVLVLGFPSFLILKYLKILNFYTLSLIGLPLGFLSAVITDDLNDHLWLRTACITGLVISTIASVLMIEKPNKVKNVNASEAGPDASSTRPF